jgi:hypothetical protein
MKLEFGILKKIISEQVISERSQNYADVTLSDGTSSAYGSSEHVEEMESILTGLLRLRNQQKLATAARSNYARSCQHLKAQIKKYRQPDTDEQISEALGALKMLDTASAKLVLSKGMKVEEVVTGIRIIKGISTVIQNGAIERTKGGHRIMQIVITFDPGHLHRLEYVDLVAKLTKKMHSVETVVINAINGKPVKDETGKRKLVY